MNVRTPLAAAAALLLTLPLAACSGGDEDGSTLTVLAAASLTESFTEIAEQFEADHTGVDVELVFGSSGALAEQVLEGGAADVLATADEASMDKASDAQADEPTVFATNTMVIVTPADNPAGIDSVADLSGKGVDFAVCADTAPCGVISAALLSDNDISAEPVSLEVDVKSVLARVTSGEVDAGLVYATDAHAAGDAVHVVEVAGADDHVTNYPVVALEDAADADLAAQFVEAVTSEAGLEVLGRAGFGRP